MLGKLNESQDPLKERCNLHLGFSEHLFRYDMQQAYPRVATPGRLIRDFLGCVNVSGEQWA